MISDIMYKDDLFFSNMTFGTLQKEVQTTHPEAKQWNMYTVDDLNHPKELKQMTVRKNTHYLNPIVLIEEPLLLASALG